MRAGSRTRPVGERDASRAAVGAIAEERRAGVRGVHADLVRASGDGRDREHRLAARRDRATTR